MATFNLIRNSRVFFTTNVNATTGKVSTAGAFTGVNTQEITVLDGFSFSQGTNADTITMSEAGSAPSRGERSFNTSLNPVDFSFSTYLKPALHDTVRAEESHLWNALLGTTAVEDAGSPIVYTGTLVATITAATSTTAAILEISATTIGGATLNDIVTLRGATGSTAGELNTQYKVTALTSTTGISLTFLTPPETATGTVTTGFGATSTTAAPAFWLHKTSWVGYPASTDTGTVAGVNKIGTTSYAEASTARSNVNQLLTFGMIIVVDNITYIIDNCALDQASIDFGLDGIATVAWTGKGTALTQAASTMAIVAAAGATGFIPGTVAFTAASTGIVFGTAPTPVLKAGTVLRYKGEVMGILSADTVTTAGTLTVASTRTITTATGVVYGTSCAAITGGVGTGFIAPKFTGSNYITNKLSTCTLTSGLGGTGTSYIIALTGGNIQIANNINYVTPANIGVVNAPIGYYTGTRAITGSLNAYLRTGTTATILSTILTNIATATETKYELGIQLGGVNNGIRVELLCPGTSIQVPTVDAQAVLSTVINFTVQGFEGFTSTSANYDLEAVNDMRVRYFGV